MSLHDLVYTPTKTNTLGVRRESETKQYKLLVVLLDWSMSVLI